MPKTNFEKSLHMQFGSMLQGNILPIIELMQSVDKQSLTEANLATCEAFLNRFISKTFPEDRNLPDFIQTLLQLYYHYWHGVLMQVNDVETAENELAKQLSILLVDYGQTAGEMRSFEKLEEATMAYVERLGFGIQMDVTRPYRECMVWKSQTSEAYDIELHDGKSRVKVSFLEDFVCLGWLGFASFNKMHTGGWATRDAIYRVGALPKNDMDERFQLDILYHEGRHFLDYILFPKLQQPELEYRAKLTELCYADETMLHRIEQFINTGSRCANNAPHAVAAYYVMRDLSLAIFATPTPPIIEKWGSLDNPRVHQAAATILDQNNGWLENNYPQEIESFLDVFEFQPSPRQTVGLPSKLQQ